MISYSDLRSLQQFADDCIGDVSAWSNPLDDYGYSRGYRAAMGDLLRVIKGMKNACELRRRLALEATQRERRADK